MVVCNLEYGGAEGVESLSRSLGCLLKGKAVVMILGRHEVSVRFHMSWPRGLVGPCRNLKQTLAA